MTVQEDYQPSSAGSAGRAADRAAALSTKQAALLPTLWLAQREHGWISDRIMAEVAKCSA